MTTQFKHTTAILGVLLSAMAFSVPVSADDLLSSGGYDRAFRTMGMHRMIDANGDRKVSHDEYIDYYKVVFNEMDTNHNDFIDGKEWIGLKGEQDISVATGGYSRQLRTMEMLRAKDTNHDLKVSKEEFFNYHEAQFKAIDTAGSGDIDAQNWLRRQTKN